MSNARHYIQANDSLILDGSTGEVHIEPERKTLTHFRSQIRDERQRRKDLFNLKNRPCKTLDGLKISLYGNIDRPEDVRVLRQFDHTGVGLYRTEMMFIEHNHMPDEDEQFEVYRRALRALKGHPLTIRTMDLGLTRNWLIPRNTGHWYIIRL